MCSLEEAIHKTAKEFSEGTKGLAIRIGVRPGNLQNKVDPGMPDHVLNVNEALSMMLVANDFRILEVLAHETGHGVVPLPKTEFPGDLDMLTAWAEWSTEIGETAAALKEALAGGSITRAKADKIKRELIEDFQKGMALFGVVDKSVEPDEKVTPIKRAK